MGRRCIIALVAVVLLLSGCKKPNDEPVKEHKQKEIENVQKEDIFPYDFPLTGIGTKDKVNHRPFAVMINNHPKARPQSGIDQADIVYEILAEGSVTRFLAIFQSEKPERIGPVRSARDYYIELAKGYNSLFIAHGYSPDAKKMLDSGYIDSINGIQYDGTLFKRDKSRVAPHNSYISYENMMRGAERKNYPMKMMIEPLLFLSKEEQEQLDGSTGEKVTVAYYNHKDFTVTYEYDAEKGKYKRFTNGIQTINNETRNPVLLSNIFIVETSHRTIDSAGRRDINLTSGGKAYLLQKGVLRPVEWKNVSGQIVPVLDGAVVGLIPGKTWINIVPDMKFVKVDTN